MSVKTRINNIPASISKNHNEVFYDWFKSGIEKGTLLHIDGHSDMASGPSHKNKNWLHNNNLRRYTSELTIGNFICAGIHYGIISDVYWLNPYSKTHLLQFMGTTSDNGLIKIITKKEGDKNNSMIEMKRINKEKNLEYDTKKGVIIKNYYELPSKDLILDIDLDAFCCDKYLDHVKEQGPYLEINNYLQRIELTRRFLEKQATPKLITISRSEGFQLGGSKSHSFVPENLLNIVQTETINMLKRVYK